MDFLDTLTYFAIFWINIDLDIVSLPTNECVFSELLLQTEKIFPITLYVGAVLTARTLLLRVYKRHRENIY